MFYQEFASGKAQMHSVTPCDRASTGPSCAGITTGPSLIRGLLPSRNA